MFLYTFTDVEATAGKVTFRVQLIPLGVRDAVPDNDMLAAKPTTVRARRATAGT